MNAYNAYIAYRPHSHRGTSGTVPNTIACDIVIIAALVFVVVCAAMGIIGALKK